MQSNATGRHNARHGQRSVAESPAIRRFVSPTADGPGHTPVLIEYDDGSRDQLPLYRGVAAHSRGFGWGYVGSGPAQLALAICIEVCADLRDAEAHYQTVKRALISKQPRDEPLELDAGEVRQFLYTIAEDGQTGPVLGGAV